jgi:hypothetical protein
MSDQFILVGREVIHEPDLLKWGKWFQENRDKRIIARNDVEEIRVSTVFLGIDHSYGEGCPLQVFETMIFGGENDQYCERYSNYDDAEIGHKKALELVKNEKKSI